MVISCTFNFSMAQAEMREYHLTFNIISHIDGMPSLKTSFSKTIMPDYPGVTATVQLRLTPELVDNTLDVSVFYPYSFGKKLVLWIDPSYVDRPIADRKFD